MILSSSKFWIREIIDYFVTSNVSNQDQLFSLDATRNDNLSCGSIKEIVITLNGFSRHYLVPLNRYSLLYLFIRQGFLCLSNQDLCLLEHQYIFHGWRCSFGILV